MLYAVMKYFHVKHHRVKKKADAWPLPLPPRVTVDLKKLQTWALRYTNIVNNNDGTFSVGSMSTVGKVHKVSITFGATDPGAEKSIGCNCGRRHVVERYFCGHEVAVLMLLQLDAADYIDILFTTKQWRKQYERTYEIPESFDAAINGVRKEPVEPDNEEIGFHAAPAEPPRKGRPSNQRIKNALEVATDRSTTRTKRKCGTCKKMTFHNKRTCRGNAELSAENDGQDLSISYVEEVCVDSADEADPEDAVAAAREFLFIHTDQAQMAAAAALDGVPTEEAATAINAEQIAQGGELVHAAAASAYAAAQQAGPGVAGQAQVAALAAFDSVWGE